MGVNLDIGLAATTGRFEDVGRFRVPHLRDLRNIAPYFHDDSALTIEEVVDYFNSQRYNHSKDGRRFRIHLNPVALCDLIEILKVIWNLTEEGVVRIETRKMWLCTYSLLLASRFDQKISERDGSFRPVLSR